MQYGLLHERNICDTPGAGPGVEVVTRIYLEDGKCLIVDATMIPLGLVELVGGKIVFDWVGQNNVYMEVEPWNPHVGAIFEINQPCP